MKAKTKRKIKHNGKTLYRPGYSKGLLDLTKYTFLLKLVVRKEIKARYRNSILGLLWTYIKPAVSFGVYYFFVGFVMSRNRALDAYAVYLFSGMVVVFLFDETFRNCTRSIRGNAALVKKIYLPREIFPTASYFVAMVHFLPQLAILLIGSIVCGWRPDVISICSILFAILIVTVFTMGLGFIFAALNVFFMDSQNFVDMVSSVSTWFSPVLYTAPLILKIVPHWLFVIYSVNPVTAAVNLFHYGFWFKATTNPAMADSLSPNTLKYGMVAMAISIVTLIIGQIVFRKMEGKFAQEL